MYTVCKGSYSMYIIDQINKQLSKEIIGKQLTENDISTQIKTCCNALGIKIISSIIVPFAKVENGYATNFSIEYNNLSFLIYIVFIGKKKGKVISISNLEVGYEALW